MVNCEKNESIYMSCQISYFVTWYKNKHITNKKNIT